MTRVRGAKGRGATVRGAEVRRRMARLDPVADADELARRSLVTLHGSPTLVYALFTVAFLKQVAVPDMARTLYRRGTGDIVRQTLKRNDDTIVFFGHLLDHGPDSPTGRAWIARLNEIHAHFPLRDADSVYTLATLALDPHELTRAQGASPFTAAEREAHWRFWRAVAAGQELRDVPASRAELETWAALYEQREHGPSEDGRQVARALVRGFGERCLPRPLRGLAPRILSALCPPGLRRVHDLPEPGAVVGTAVRVALRLYVATTDVRRVPLDRSLAVDFGDRRHGVRPPEEVGYQRPSARGRTGA